MRQNGFRRKIAAKQKAHRIRRLLRRFAGCRTALRKELR